MDEQTSSKAKKTARSIEPIDRDFYRKIVTTYGTRIFNVFAGLITSIIVARSLGPEGKGILTIIAAVGMIGVQFGNLGLHATNIFYVAKDRNLFEILFANSIFVGVVFGSTGMALALLFFQLWPETAPLPGMLLIFALLQIPFGLLDLFFQHLLIGLQRIDLCNRIEFTRKLAILALILLCLAFHLSVTMVFLIGLSVLLVGIYWSYRRLLDYAERKPQTSMAIYRKTFAYGFKSYLGALFMYLLLKIDLFMINSRLGEGATGIYSIAVSIADMIGVLSYIVNSLTLPLIAPITNYREKWQKARTVIFGSIGAMTILCAIAALLAEPVIVVLFGNRFQEAAPALLILLPGILLLSTGSILQNFVASIDNARSGPVFGLVLVICNYYLNDILIDRMGIEGAALASTICYALYLPYALYYLLRVLGNPDYKVIW